jgi:hypothetical protein
MRPSLVCSPASVLLLLLLGACEQPAMTGPPCELNSDCADPLVCVDGHCAIECVSQRDCIRGAHCAVVDGVGRCLIDVPLDTTTSPCGRGRPCFDDSVVCRGYTCWNACTTSADCADGSLCRQGICANPDSQGGAYGVHVACDATHPCADGEVCASHAGSARACYRTCAADTECTDIAATQLCAELEDASLPAHTTVCVIGCDPVRQRGCLGTDRCELSVELRPGASAETATFFECRGATGTSQQGDVCGTLEADLDACARGLGCVFAGSDGGDTYECRRYCTTEGDCTAGGLTCTGGAPTMIENVDVIGGGTLHVCVAP